MRKDTEKKFNAKFAKQTINKNGRALCDLGVLARESSEKEIGEKVRTIDFCRWWNQIGVGIGTGIERIDEENDNAKNGYSAGTRFTRNRANIRRPGTIPIPIPTPTENPEREKRQPDDPLAKLEKTTVAPERDPLGFGHFL